MASIQEEGHKEEERLQHEHEEGEEEEEETGDKGNHTTPASSADTDRLHDPSPLTKTVVLYEVSAACDEDSLDMCLNLIIISKYVNGGGLVGRMSATR